MRRKSIKRRKRSAHRTKRPSRNSKRPIQTAPRTAKQYFAMSPKAQDIWDRVAQVPGVMRSRGLSLRKASEEFGLKPDVVRGLARSALRKRSNGRYVAKSKDQLLRVLLIPSRKGLREIVLRDSGQATIVGKYWSALERYLVTGDTSELQKFRKERIRDANGKRVALLTNIDELRTQASAGVLRFESLYGRAA